MAQKIVTMCDAHLHTEEAEVPGLAWEVTLLGPDATKPTTWSVDLCRADGKTLEDLAVMLGAVGRVIDGPRKPRKATAARESTPAPASSHAAPTEPANGSMVPVPCPIAGCEAVPANRVALASHLRANHDGMTMAKAYGKPEPYACPEPGCEFRSARPQGLGAHRKAAHGTSGGGPAVVSSAG